LQDSPQDAGSTVGKCRREKEMRYWQIYTVHAPSVQSRKPKPQSLRKFEGACMPISSVRGEYLISTDSYLDELKKLDEIEQISVSEIEQISVSGQNDDASKARPIELRRCSTESREYWHADTIPLGKIWNHMKDAFVIVDDFTRMSFVYPIKDHSQYSVAAALEEHFLQQWPTPTGFKGINFFINRTVFRSDRGTELINSSL